MSQPYRVAAELLQQCIAEADKASTVTTMELLDDIEQPQYQALAGRSVLMVEADPLESIKIRTALRQWNLVNPVHRVGTVSGLVSYLQGSGAYRDRDHFPYPGVILLSAELPNLDSTRAQAWIRVSLTHRKMPIIIVGESRCLPLMEAAVKFGANGYMTKPFDAREFHCICRVLRLPVFFENQKSAPIH